MSILIATSDVPQASQVADRAPRKFNNNPRGQQGNRKAGGGQGGKI